MTTFGVQPVLTLSPRLTKVDTSGKASPIQGCPCAASFTGSADVTRSGTHVGAWARRRERHSDQLSDELTQRSPR